MNIGKILEIEARKSYLAQLSKIPEQIKHQDAAKHIIKIWASRGIGRDSKMEFCFRSASFPRYIFLYLGPEDRATDINMFLEEMEELFGLEFDSAEITDDGAAYMYGKWMLKIHFLVHTSGTCRVVKKETEPTIIHNYEHSIVCD